MMAFLLSTPLHVVCQKRTMDVIYAPAAKDSSLFPVIHAAI